MSCNRAVIKFLMLLAFICFSQCGWAKDGFSAIKGEDLKRWCASAVQAPEKVDAKKSAADVAFDVASCITYIVAVNDTLYMQAGTSAGVSDNKDAKIKMPYCLPDNLSIDDYVNAVLRYIDGNPDASDVHASIVVYGAFVKNYPCD